jgi:small conductance mechanosensitive channel
MLKQTLQELLRQLGIGPLPPWADALIAISNVLLILLLAWIALRLARRLLRLFGDQLQSKAERDEDKRRIETLLRVFRYILSVVLGVVTIMLVLSEVGISIAPILATAGVAGIAVGFGAQSLVKDYFTGFVMLIENQIRQGDVVQIAGLTGTVEDVTLRYVQLRDYEGAVHFVPNGAITTVTNRSRVFAYAVADIGIAYKEDIEGVYAVMREAAQSLRNRPELASRILDGLEIAGVDQWADSSVVIKCRMKVVAGEQWLVRREFLKALKHAFDANGIEIPFPHRTVVNLPAAPLEGPKPAQSGHRAGADGE